ncbi:hypothetical protein BC937DRAFT_95663 [Endogone sp. FLAS-F59071]|nr:hypothetical protein BC937DRAFT_95663 [Endogone sp. FLAS-F59071]|eukprot:RUS13213.1 hypothetical protein BC937DRAFT_95663 [Endogone sp. FLAS-F59071]
MPGIEEVGNEMQPRRLLRVIGNFSILLGIGFTPTHEVIGSINLSGWTKPFGNWFCACPFHIMLTD